MLGALLGIVALALWLLAELLIALWFWQDYLLYLPFHGGRRGVSRKLRFNVPGYRSPAERRLAFEEVLVPSGDAVVHSWLLLQPQSAQAPTIIFFHGNAGNIGYRLPQAQDILSNTACNLLMVDYRGYGSSEGQPSFRGLQQDAEAVLNYLATRADIEPRSIFLYGQSLGGAVAIWAAARFPERVRGLVVENTFTSIEDMVVVLAERLKLSPGPWFRTFLRWFLRSPWDSLSLMPRIRIPTLFLSGLKDELIPPEQMRALFEACESERKLLFTVPEGTHNDTDEVGGRRYYDAFSRFISDTLS